MKGCLLAGVILLMVLGGVIINAIYIHHTADELMTMVRELPAVPDPEQTPLAIMKIRERLEERSAVLGITVTYAAIDRVSEALIALESYARTEDRRQYVATLALLPDLIDELARTEKLSMDNIL